MTPSDINDYPARLEQACNVADAAIRDLDHTREQLDDLVSELEEIVREFYVHESGGALLCRREVSQLRNLVERYR